MSVINIFFADDTAAFSDDVISAACDTCDEAHKSIINGRLCYSAKQYTESIENFKLATTHLPRLVALWPHLCRAFLKVHSYYPAEEAARYVLK